MDIRTSVCASVDIRIGVRTSMNTLEMHSSISMILISASTWSSVIVTYGVNFKFQLKAFNIARPMCIIFALSCFRAICELQFIDIE